MKKIKFSPIYFLILGISLTLVGIGVLIYIKRVEKRNEFKTVHDPKKAEAVARSLVEIVSKIYILPNELPTIATVTDTKILPDNAFFQNAKEGDKILVFAKAHKAIIYRPSINKVVDVADITLDTELNAQVAAVATDSAELEVTVTPVAQPTTPSLPLQ